jgi:hypothetical protein
MKLFNFTSGILRCHYFVYLTMTTNIITDVQRKCMQVKQRSLFLGQEKTKVQMETNKPTYNKRLAQWREKWLIEHSTSHQLLWCIDSFVLRNLPLRQAPAVKCRLYFVRLNSGVHKLPIAPLP